MVVSPGAEVAMASGLVVLILMAGCGSERPAIPVIGVPVDVTEHDLVGWKVEPAKDRAGVVHYTETKAGRIVDVALGEGQFWRATAIGTDAQACAGLSEQTAALGEPAEAVCADRVWAPVLGEGPMYLKWTPGEPCIFGASREHTPLVAPPLGDKADVRGVAFGAHRADVPGLAPVTRELVNEPSVITPDFLAMLQAKAAREGKPIPQAEQFDHAGRYFRADEDLTLGDAKLQAVVFHFDDGDTLRKVELIPGPGQAATLSAAMVSAYGQPTGGNWAGCAVEARVGRNGAIEFVASVPAPTGPADDAGSKVKEGL